MSKSSQDVRSHILALRDELIDSLEMIRGAIRADRENMQAYFQRFGDFKYRPVTGRNTDGSPNAWGTPTEVIIEPLSTQMRTTVKSLIDSIRVIEAEILPEDNPEGTSSVGTGSLEKRAALRADFRAQAGTAAATVPVPTDEEENSEPITRTPKEVTPQSGTPLEPPKPKTEPAPKPWRETTPRAVETPKPASSQPNPIVVEEPMQSKPMPNRDSESKAIGLSPKLRASLNGTVAESRMDAMRRKYAKGEDDNA